MKSFHKQTPSIRDISLRPINFTKNTAFLIFHEQKTLKAVTDNIFKFIWAYNKTNPDKNPVQLLKDVL